MTETPHILIVEDSADIRNAVSRYLEKNRVRTTKVSNAQDMDGRQALRRFELLVLEVMMPDEYGISICNVCAEIWSILSTSSPDRKPI